MNAQSAVAQPLHFAWSGASPRAISEVLAARFFNGCDSDNKRISREDLRLMLEAAANAALEHCCKGG